MGDTENKSTLMNNLASISKPENIQKYILGTKKNGCPRALYDIVKDYTRPKKKKKKGTDGNTYSLYLQTKHGKKHNKKKKKKNKYWHI